MIISELNWRDHCVRWTVL